MSGKITTLASMIKNSSNIVFLGGAGVSTESGIPDFRSKTGLYNAKKIYGYSPEEILSYNFFTNNPSVFYKYTFENIVFENAIPNKAHYALAEMEKHGNLKAVLTQNIDALHQKAGSKKVIELHGSALRYYCMKCKTKYNYSEALSQSLKNESNVPFCSKCSGLIRPDIVLYGEPLNSKTISYAVNSIHNADMLIIGGTSLTVYPVAGFIDYFTSDNIVLINKDTTPFDKQAKLVINESIGKTLDAVLKV